MRRSFTQVAIVIGVFGAASVVGGIVKLPVFAASVAIDSLPGYFVAGYFGPLLGGAVGAIGHLASALSGGLPFGHLHFVIAASMFFWCVAFGWVFNRLGRFGPYFATLLAMILNGVVSPLLLIPFGLPAGTAYSLIPILLVATALNAGLGAIAARLLSRAPKRQRREAS